MGPLSATHPAVGLVCPACSVRLAVDDYVALVPLGPGADPAARGHRDAGKAYDAVGAVVHWECSPKGEGEAEWRATQDGTAGS
jgi:hypothetical protein